MTVDWRKVWFESLLSDAGDYLVDHGSLLATWRSRIDAFPSAIAAARDDGASPDVMRAMELAAETLRARIAAVEHGWEATATTEKLLDADLQLSYRRMRLGRFAIAQKLAGIDVPAERFDRGRHAATVGLRMAREIMAGITSPRDDELLTAAVVAQIDQAAFELDAIERLTSV